MRVYLHSGTLVHFIFLHLYLVQKMEGCTFCLCKLEGGSLCVFGTVHSDHLKALADPCSEVEGFFAYPVA